MSPTSAGTSPPGKNLYGKVAIVTGGGSGIGRATALEFSRRGAKVVIGEVMEDTGKKTVEAIRRLRGEATYIRTDVSEWESVQNLVSQTVEKYNHLDIMFNNAGISSRGTDVLEVPIDVYHRVIKVNQDGVFYGIRAAGTAMKKRGGVIINTASFYGLLAVPDMMPYVTSKGAVIAMTKVAARDLAKYNIRVVAIAPGFIETGLTSPIKANPALWEIKQKQQLHGKAGTPEDVARVVAFLASDDASFVNGSIVLADDGAAAFKH
jgi:glucose 1-dehydrogenase